MVASVRVPVNASIWDWITKIGFLGNLSSDDHRNIERWRAGEGEPTINQLSQFSRKLRVPFGYFFVLYREAVERMKADDGTRLTSDEVYGKDYRPIDDGYEPELGYVRAYPRAYP